MPAGTHLRATVTENLSGREVGLSWRYFAWVLWANTCKEPLRTGKTVGQSAHPSVHWIRPSNWSSAVLRRTAFLKPSSFAFLLFKTLEHSSIGRANLKCVYILIEGLPSFTKWEWVTLSQSNQLWARSQRNKALLVQRIFSLVCQFLPCRILLF